MNTQHIPFQKRSLHVAFLALGLTLGASANAAMLPDSDLNYVKAASGGIVQPASGSWFSMLALDLSGGPYGSPDGIPETYLYTPIGQSEGIKLGVIQTPSGSHSGSPDGSESPTVDVPWLFFSNTGMHGSAGTAVTVVSDDTAGNVTLDMAGWLVDWNEVIFDMSGGGTATVTCMNTCEYGDTYVLDYTAIVPSGSFAGVEYNLHLEGTITQRPASNSAPVANNDMATVDRKASGKPYTPKSINVLVNDTDPDGNSDIDVTSVSLVTMPSNGTAMVDTVSGSITYTPNDDYLGSDMFDYTIGDLGGPEGVPGILTSNAATVSITVQNAVPVAANDSASIDTATDSTVDIPVLSNDTDPDGAVVATSVQVVTNATNGTLDIDPVSGVVTYTPDTGYIGLDSFTYTFMDNDATLSNAATVNLAVTDSSAGVLDPAAFFILATGQVQAALIEPPVGDGSWFSMEVEPGKPLHTPIAGFNHLQLGTTQPASSPSGTTSLSPDIDQGWQFFGNIGVHQTTAPITIITDDGTGNVTLDFSGWDVSWNGIPSIPLGDGPDVGVATLTCYMDLELLQIGDCSFGDEFVLDYRAIVPPGDPSGFGGVNYGLHLEGVISETGVTIGGGDGGAAFDVTVASVVDKDLNPLTITPGSIANAGGNTTGFGLTPAQIGKVDPLLNSKDGTQCFGGCFDFVVSGVTTDYVDVVFKLNDAITVTSAQLRKLIDGRWRGFDTSSGDLVGSANTDTSGNCQSPAGVFSIGLRLDAQCVYLRIYDGGPNDADGLKNGTIIDPAGLLIAGSPNVPASSTDGCSIGDNHHRLIERADIVILMAFLVLMYLRNRYAGWQRRD